MTATKKRRSPAKPVKCVELGTIYPSAYRASLETGIGKGHILRTCNGLENSAGGYNWVFVADSNEHDDGDEPAYPADEYGADYNALAHSREIV